MMEHNDVIAEEGGESWMMLSPIPADAASSIAPQRISPQAVPASPQTVVDSASVVGNDSETIARIARNKELYLRFKSVGCEYCGSWHGDETPPYQTCNYCHASPSFHHGRCCPRKPAASVYRSGC